MVYNYEYLRSQGAKRNIIGKWKGTPILPISKNGFKILWEESRWKSDLYYLIYDDENKLIKNNVCYGYLKENGDVETSVLFKYLVKNKPAVPPPDQQEAADLFERADGLSIAAIIEDVDKLLKSSCSWSEAYG